MLVKDCEQNEVVRENPYEHIRSHSNNYQFMSNGAKHG